jgi:hypothetical protein
LIKNIKISALILIIIATGIATGLGSIENRISSIKTYPATVCPGTNSDGSASAILPNSKVLGTSIPSNLNKMKAIGSTVFSSKKALLVDGGQVTSISVLHVGGALAAVNCSISDGNDWFVGGSANVSSAGTVAVINSGLSAAIVDLKVYSSKAAITVSKTIPANSAQYILTDSLAPGEDVIAINAITRAGRVSIFMLDNRKKGLRAMGADYVSPAPAPSKSIVIPNIPTTKDKNGQVLRVVVPGNVSANLKATILSSDGSFAPIGVDGASIDAGTVKDITFKPVVADSSYSLRLDADVPISASVLTVNSGDLIWANAVAPISQTSLQLGGFTPLFRFYGKAIDINLNWIDSNGKHSGKRILGNDTFAFRPKVGLTRVAITSNQSDTYGALLVNSGGGYALLPIASGSHLESAVLPRSDARTINRG